MSDAGGLIEAATGCRPVRLSPLAGGNVGQVLRADMPGGETLVAKIGGPGSGLETEGWMLRYLASHSALPLPEVRHADDDLLLMSHIEARDAIDARAELHAADLIAALHDVAAPDYGLERDTRIGGLVQPNPPGRSWRAYFRDHRLLYMARQALDAQRLDAATLGRIERLAARLDGWLDEPDRPSLLHGDLWTGNILARAGRVVGLIDPAIYYGDAEMDLAFSTLFGTFGSAFFGRYAERRPIRPRLLRGSPRSLQPVPAASPCPAVRRALRRQRAGRAGQVRCVSAALLKIYYANSRFREKICVNLSKTSIKQKFFSINVPFSIVDANQGR